MGNLNNLRMLPLGVHLFNTMLVDGRRLHVQRQTTMRCPLMWAWYIQQPCFMYALNLDILKLERMSRWNWEAVFLSSEVKITCQDSSSFKPQNLKPQNLKTFKTPCKTPDNPKHHKQRWEILTRSLTFGVFLLFPGGWDQWNTIPTFQPHNPKSKKSIQHKALRWSLWFFCAKDWPKIAGMNLTSLKVCDPKCAINSPVKLQLSLPDKFLITKEKTLLTHALRPFFSSSFFCLLFFLIFSLF